MFGHYELGQQRADQALCFWRGIPYHYKPRDIGGLYEGCMADMRWINDTDDPALAHTALFRLY